MFYRQFLSDIPFKGNHILCVNEKLKETVASTYSHVFAKLFNK